MKKLLPVLLAVALIVPAGQADAAKTKKVAIESCAGDKDVKSISLGKEVVYTSADKSMVSFTKTAATPVKYHLVYFCADDSYFRKTPGVGPNGHVLVPGFRHGDTWYALSKDENGNPMLTNAPATSAHISDAAPVVKPAKKVKKAKKAKSEKKAKKEKKAIQVEDSVPDVVPGSEPPPGGR